MFELKTFDEVGADAWDKFVMATDNGSIHQLSSWKALQESVPTRGKTLGWATYKNGQIQAVALLTRMQTGVLNTEWYYCGRGPVFADRKAASYLIKQITNKLKDQKKAIFWRFDPYILRSEKPLALGGIKAKPATQNYHPPDTIIVDLAQGSDTVWRNLKPKKRYNIRYGRNNCNSIVIPADKVTPQDVNDFYDLLQTAANRDDFNAHPKAYYENFLKYLAPYTTLWFALHNNKRVAASIATVCGNTGIYYFAALSDNAAARKAHASHHLLWEIIKYAERQGVTRFDLLGVAPEGAKNHPYSGITTFKESFGGQRVSYQPGVEISLRPKLHWLYKLAKRIKQ